MADRNPLGSRASNIFLAYAVLIVVWLILELTWRLRRLRAVLS